MQPAREIAAPSSPRGSCEPGPPYFAWGCFRDFCLGPSEQSRRLGRLQPQSRLDGFAHHEFLDLAGDGHRKLVDEFDVARDLVVRDLALAEGAYLVGGQALAGPDADPGAQLLAVALVGDAENLHVLDLRMAIQEFLDLARIEVFAAADHQVLDAADDVAIAFVIDDGDIAGVHPAL